MDELLGEFLAECAENMTLLDSELVRLEREPGDRELIAGIFRIVHTIKGTCGFLGLPRLEAVAHAGETMLGRLRDGSLPPSPERVALILDAADRIRAILDGLAADGAEPAGDDAPLIAALEALADRRKPAAPAGEPAPISTMPEEDASGSGSGIVQTIRVRVDLLEQLMTLAGELVLTRNQLLQLLRQRPDGVFGAPLHRLNQITAELQEGVTRTRVQPVGHAWSTLPRLVRDLARDLGKSIDLQLHGAATELDRQVLDTIRDPLIHMVRNAADHGLETPERRRAAGKPGTGTIRLRAFHEGGHLIVEVGDDGRGLDVAGIAARALAQGLASEADLAAMSPAQIQQFIFRAGLSTAGAVTTVSGRGVGMDVVRVNLERIGGTVELRSAPGAGTTVAMRIPLTLAIVAALIVGVGDERFAIPQIGIVELVRAGAGREHRIERIDTARILRLRDRLVPLLDLAALLGLEQDGAASRATDEDVLVVVAQVGARTVGLAVDRILDTEEIVVKPLAAILRPLPMFAGNTILGDGTVVMILDLNGVAGHVQEHRHAGAPSLEKAIEARPERTTVLLFRAGEGADKAVPLALVTRLEELAPAAIERSAGRSVMQYRGRLMPLVDITGAAAPVGRTTRPVLVLSDAGRDLGLVVDRIVDIAEGDARVDVAGGDGVLGSAIVGDRAVDMVDVAFLVRHAFGGWFEPRTHEDFPGSEGPHARRVLLVDDSSFFRNLLGPILRGAGYEVATADGPATALALHDRGHEVDLIVSDIEMPGMDGFGFARAVRDGSAWRRVPIIALSSHATERDIERGRRAGFTDHVGKLDREAVLAALARAIALLEDAA